MFQKTSSASLDGFILARFAASLDLLSSQWAHAPPCWLGSLRCNDDGCYLVQRIITGMNGLTKGIQRNDIQKGTAIPKWS